MKWPWNKKISSPQTPLVLIIDDEEDVCSMLQMALSDKQIAAAVAHDGEQGLAMLKAQPPALLLLDIKMPKMNGYQLLAALQQSEATAKIPVFVISSMTSGSDKTDAEWAESLNVVRVISKPFDPLQVAEDVATQLAKA